MKKNLHGLIYLIFSCFLLIVNIANIANIAKVHAQDSTSLYTTKSKQDNDIAILFEKLNLWINIQTSLSLSRLKKHFNILITDQVKPSKTEQSIQLPSDVQIHEYWFTYCSLDGTKIFHQTELSSLNAENKKICSGITINQKYKNQFLDAIKFNLKVDQDRSSFKLIKDKATFPSNLWRNDSVFDRRQQEYSIYSWKESYFFINVINSPKA